MPVKDKPSFNVHISVDMVKIENRGEFNSVLWCPFDDNTPLARITTTATTVAELEIQLRRIVEEQKTPAKERVTATGDKFNGFRVSCSLDKWQRKPRGWNQSRNLRIEVTL